MRVYTLKIVIWAPSLYSAADAAADTADAAAAAGSGGGAAAGVGGGAVAAAAAAAATVVVDHYGPTSSSVGFRKALGLAIFVVIASSYVNLPSSKARNTCTVARHLASRQQPRKRPYRSKCIVAVRPIIAPSVFHCFVGRAFHLHKGARAVESSPPK